MPPRPIIIDCDPGQDDALALLLALGSPDELEVLAVTAVAGNVPLALTQENARKVIELAGRRDLPVHAGAERPLVRYPRLRQSFDKYVEALA
jgi:purine nucleosidase